jgi:hypothetical protein
MQYILAEFPPEDLTRMKSNVGSTLSSFEDYTEERSSTFIQVADRIHFV